jgi:hypothetical protein
MIAHPVYGGAYAYGKIGITASYDGVRSSFSRWRTEAGYCHDNIGRSEWNQSDRDRTDHETCRAQVSPPSRY